MSDAYIYVPDLREAAKSVENKIHKQVLQDDDRTRVILFAFAAGQELAAHTAPFPATLTFLKGEAVVRLGDDELHAGEGAFAYMPANLLHGIKAETDAVMLLTIAKNR